MLTRLGWMRNITMQFFFKTGLSKADILRFFDFQNGRCRHHLFLKSPIFWLTVSRGWRLMCMSNFGKIGQSVVKILRIFVFFQDGGRRYHGLSNSQNFIGPQCPEGPDASLYQISSKSVVPYRLYCNFANFQKGGCRHLWFWSREILLAIVVKRVQSISMPNFVKIGQSVVKILNFFNFSRWRPPPSWIFEIVNF